MCVCDDFDLCMQVYIYMRVIRYGALKDEAQIPMCVELKFWNGTLQMSPAK